RSYPKCVDRRQTIVPKAVANHNLAGKSRRVITRIETSPQLRPHSQQLKIIRRDAKYADSRRLLRTGEIIFVEPRRRYVLENSGTLQVLPFGLGHPDIARAEAGKIVLNAY